MTSKVPVIWVVVTADRSTQATVGDQVKHSAERLAQACLTSSTDGRKGELKVFGLGGRSSDLRRWLVNRLPRAPEKVRSKSWMERAAMASLSKSKLIRDDCDPVGERRAR